MRIISQQFLGKNHSWSVVGRNLARAFIKLGHDVHLMSTNGIQHFPEDLKPNLLGFRSKGVDKYLLNKYKEYDMQFSYTAMHNFPAYLSHGAKNRFGIYNYDGSVIPKGWAKYHNFIDKLLPSSEYSKNIFLNNNIPKGKLAVIHHGINKDDFELPDDQFYKLKTNKKVKILNVCGQAHRRKNLEGILNAYNRAFTKKDDVCLVLKVVNKKPMQPFELSFSDLFKRWKRKNPNHADIEVIYDYIDNIESLFLTCDIHFSLSNIECFHIPSLQGMAAGNVVIASNNGGNLDFMNDRNSLLVSGKEGRCPKNYQYWTPSVYAKMFVPDLEDASSKLKYAVDNLDALKEKFSSAMSETVDKFTWDNVASQMLSLCEV